MIPLLADGDTNKQITRRLHPTEHTVENYITLVLATTECRSRTELAVKVVGSGLHPRLNQLLP